MIRTMMGVILACVIALPAWGAESDSSGPLYFGVAISGALYRDDRSDVPDFNMAGGTLKIGYDIIPWVAIEAHTGSTIDDSEKHNGEKMEARLEWFTSLYGRINLLTGKIRPYLLLGYTRAKFNSNADSDVALPNQVNDFSYGGGIELYGNQSTALSLEFIRVADKSNYRIDIASLGIVHHF